MEAPQKIASYEKWNEMRKVKWDDDFQLFFFWGENIAHLGLQ